MPTRVASVPVTSAYRPVAVTAAGKAGSLHIGESKLTIVIMDSGLALGAPRNDGRQRAKNPGTEAERPTLPGGRGAVGARGGGWRGVAPKPKKFRNDGKPGRSFFGFGGAPGATIVPSGETEATGVSPLACSRPTSRRGQAKSSARPAGGASGSPLTSVRAASASTAAGRDPGPPSN